MKSPRDILLERHRSAESKLDAIRRHVLANMAKAPEESLRKLDLPGVRSSFRELLLPFRWHLAGMAAVWLTIALLNVDHPSVSASILARQQHPSSPQQLLMAFLENRRQLSELLGTPNTEPSSRPRVVVPQRRGEFQSSSALA